MRMVLMGDLHYAYRLKVRGGPLTKLKDQVFQSLMFHFKRIDSDFYISIGDLTNEGTIDELNQVYHWLEDIKDRLIHVLGNHDTLTLPKQTFQSQRLLEYVIDTEYARLIILDTTKERSWYDWGGTLSVDSLQWLQEMVHTTERGRAVFVFAHHPVFQTTARSDKRMQAIDPKLPMREILGKRPGLNVFFSGHNHVHSIIREDHWFHVQTGAVLDTLSYRIIEWDGQHFSMRMVPAGPPVLFRDILRFSRHMRGFSTVGRHRLALGQWSDTCLTVNAYAWSKSHPSEVVRGKDAVYVHDAYPEAWSDVGVALE
ncbi:MAG: metallophosphoesterase [Candidatus Carbobacillus sp.]|nr:metallophosphoesterase [Candidatus Carbobacillus sp.]